MQYKSCTWTFIRVASRSPAKDWRKLTQGSDEFPEHGEGGFVVMCLYSVHIEQQQ